MIVLTVILSSLLSLALIIFFVYIFIFARPHASLPKDKRLLCEYAHRGLHGAEVPENSLAAFELACREGKGIELDVQLSRDGEVMVFHDYTLERMSGVSKKLCELDCDELCTLSLASTDQKIPTFSEVLALVAGRVPILVELKGEDLSSELCPKVAALLLKYEGAYCIESFNPLLVKSMKKCLPGVYGGLLYTNVCRDKKKNSLLNMALSAMAFNFLARPDFIAYNKADRNSFFVRLTTRFYHAPRFVWTVKGKEELDIAKELGELPIFERE